LPGSLDLYGGYGSFRTVSDLLATIKGLDEEKKSLLHLVAELLCKNEILRQTSMCNSLNALDRDGDL
jgi:hypothetical protein